MDIVITYVNGLDPVWQKEYEACTNVPVLEKRFRDWGTLPYLLRGIEKNMPFIRKVHLVVSGESQVPQWINRQTVNVVLHKDIIPQEFLPTFNSNTIELHLHNIPDLDEEYLYFNDDFFPVLPCAEKDFFYNGKAIIRMSHHLFALDMFKKICRNSDHLARKANGLPTGILFLRPQHICSPLYRSVCQKLYNKVRSDIKETLTQTRSSTNVTQYLFLDYMYLNGLITNKKISKKHFSTAITRPRTLETYLKHPKHKLICINDVCLSDTRFARLHSAIHNGFNYLFPEKSKFEI